MTQPRSNEVLLDSEASLRLVDRALTELGVSRSDDGGDAAVEPGAPVSPVVAELVSILPGVHGEIRDAIRGVRESRDALRRAGFERLHGDPDRPTAAFAPAEMAAQLDRALGMVDALGAAEGTVREETAAAIRSGLRDELTRAIDRLRLQDVALRQLHSASSALAETDEKLSVLARTFDPERFHQG